MAKKVRQQSEVQLDTRWVRAGELPLGGITAADLHGLVPLATRAHRQIQVERDRGRMGFFDLCDPGSEHWKASKRLAQQHHKQGIEELIVLGIGGSGLGTKALQQALAPETIPGSPLAAKSRKKIRRVRVLDNVDPALVLPVLDVLDPKKTIVNVVSKSGGTVETQAQFQLFARKFRNALKGKWIEHFVLTTDPEGGELRRLVVEHGFDALSVPRNVGGRFSVLSPVGLYPAAFMGIDGGALLDGAYAMRLRCELQEVARNPAYFFAATHAILHKKSGLHVSVFMPYAEGLYQFALWFSQLWAESLGKRKTRTGKSVRAGFTPQPALGATDQHSQLQLYLEGPRDKVVVTLSVEDLGRDAALPGSADGRKTKSEHAYLAGHKLGELLNAERDATKAALVRNGVPVLDLRLPKVDAYAVGQLIAMLEVATVFAGELLNVNPLDQPAVEEGKRYAYGLMGRPGYEDLVRHVEPFRKIQKKYLI